MKPLVTGLCLILLTACRDQSVPDVSAIPVSLELVRFEDDFFAMDTTDLSTSLEQLKRRHPGFSNDFIQHILGLDDATMDRSTIETAIRKFIADYHGLYDSTKIRIPDLEKIKADIEGSLRYVRYYFPDYTLPKRFISYVGPIDAYYQASLGGYSDVLTLSGLACGLQLHLGTDFSLYQSSIGQSLYPGYISRRFTPNTIAVNAIKNIIDDIYPEDLSGKALIDQMVEKGKRLYVLDKLMPYTQDTLKIGYTEQQWKGCQENEGAIWNFFITNGLLLKNDPSLIRNYINDGPKTPELGDASPGYIGLFTGWQIVKAYMRSHQETAPAMLLKLPPRQIYEESKYRPK